MMGSWLRNSAKTHSSEGKKRRTRKPTRGNNQVAAREDQDTVEAVKDTVVEVECLLSKGKCLVILSRTSNSTHRLGLPRQIQ